MKKIPALIPLFVLFFIVAVVGIWSVSIASAANEGDIVIHEIMQNPDAVSDSKGEWFELYNASDAIVDLNGWTVRDDGSDSFVITATLEIPVGGYVVLGPNDNTATNGGVIIDFVYKDFFLSNGADELILVDDLGNEIDRVEWDGGPDFPDPRGASMSLRDPSLDNNIGSNWCTSTLPYGDGDRGSPGATNYCETCGDTSSPIYAPIYDIQGSGNSTPIPGPVSTEGIVTGLFLGDDKLNGYYIQDPDGDDDVSTSDGIFVYDPDAEGLAVGDHVRVSGTAGEFFGETQISDVLVTLTCGTGSVAETPVTLPVADTSDMESYEGMWLVFPQTLYATDHYNLHRFGEALLSVNNRLYQPTNLVDPGTEANNLQDLNAQSSLLLDDGSGNQWPVPVPYIAADGTLRLGDTTTDLTGNLGYAFGNYKLQPTEAVNFTRENAREDSPEDVGGVIKVATFNVWNYWTTLGGRGADNEAELARQEPKLVAAILGLGADIVAVQELENNDDVTINSLVGLLNDAAGAGTWAAVPEPANFTSDNAIKVGIIYKTAFLTPVGDSIAWTDPVFDIARQPVAQTFAAAEFDATPEIFTVISNHFKSKGCSDSTGLDQDQGDGQACFNETRTKEAQSILEFVAALQDSTGDQDVIVAGDFNSYAMEDPIVALEKVLTNPLASLQSSDLYSFVFFGQAGLLDNTYITDNMAGDRLKGADIWHISPDDPRALDYTDDSFATGLYVDDQYSSSDHDPVLIGVCDEVGPDIDIVLDPEVLWPPNHRHRRVTAEVTVVDNFDPNPQWSLKSVTSSESDNGKGDGNTTEDIIIIDDVTLDLRAERSGLYDGRFYTVTYEATDSCGNTTENSEIVTVPHDMRNYDPKDVKLPNKPKN
jgi:predicted extracellular nuclease